MGQCNSSAVQCCEPCSKSAQPRDILWQGAPARPSSTGKQVIKTSALSTQSAHSSAAVPRQKSTLQLSVSLDQQSDHSVCIRVELLDGQSVLLDTTLHTSNTSDTTPARNTSSSFPPKEIVAASKDEPNKSHYKDIHFSANKPEPALGPLQQLQASESSLPNLLELNKPPSRRTAFQQEECPTARLAASDGALLNTAKNRRHPMAMKENSWYHLGYASGMEESSQSLDFEGAMLSTSNNPSGHTQETKNSWGGISVKKSMNRMSLSSSTSSSNKDSNGKAQFPPIDISMNDISGNTLPTRFDYQDCQDHDDDVSETEDDDEMDLSWDYHRNIRSLTSELDTPPFPPGLSHTDSSSSLGRGTPCSALSSSTPEASPPSFISNLSGYNRPQSYACRHRHSSTFLSHANCTNDNMMMMNNHSNRSCQSDSYVVVVRRKTDESTTQTSRLPWNPHQLPAF